MNKISLVKRKEFKISELFTQDRGKEKAPKQNKDGNTRIVNEINTNNGLVRKVTPTKIFPGNAITISINYATNVFYQQNDFCASVNIAILQNNKMKKYSGLFIASLLRKYNKQYDYIEKISKEKINNTIINLPVTDSGEPNREYMENYMKGIEENCEKKIKLLKSGYDANNIDITNWKRFHLYDEGFFDIDSGTKLDKAKMKTDNPTINFVGRANANNGVTTTINEIKDLKPYPAGYMTLSLGGEYLGSCYYSK